MKAKLSKKAKKKIRAIINGFRDIISQFIIRHSINTQWFNNKPLIKINA